MVNKILLFISKNSVYFSADITSFKKILAAMEKLAPYEVETIDVSEHPELAEKYKVEALPTLIVNEKKYLGAPTSQKAIEIFGKEVKDRR